MAARAKNDERAVDTNELLPAQIPPVPRSRSQDNRGGYDCEFVEPPPSGLQTECPVCLLVLKEPCIISCCGHKLCRECIERIVKDKRPCALCNTPDFTFIPERALERSLKDLDVWCSYRKEGCEWKGELRKLEEHLNRDPSPENRLSGCQFVAVECTHKCGGWFQRRHITTHETQQCKKRPHSCDYCQDHHSTFEDVTEVHYPQCGKYPVACPNDCDVQMIERQNMESHLKEQCPLEVLDCPFSGCGKQMPRKDMPEHMKENITHLTSLVSVMKKNKELHQKPTERQDESRQNADAALQIKCNSLVERMLKDLNEKYCGLDEKKQLQKRDIDELRETQSKMNQELREHVKEELRKSTHNSMEEIRRLINETLKKFIGLLLCIGVVCIAWMVWNQQLQSQVTHEMRQSIESLEDTLHSFQLKEEELHASCDKKLKELVNKHQLTENEVKTLKEGVQKQKLEVEREMRRKEEELHASHEKNLKELHELTENKARTLKEGIQKQKLEVQQLVNHLGFPIDFHVTQTEEVPFFTHPHGYRMCVRVDPNGVGFGEETHVSISTYLMQGPFDDYLKWPFRGNITIQILNQVGDYSHVEKIIDYTNANDTCASRVTGKAISKPWGFHEFLAHNKLKYNAARKTQYLKDSILHIRVVKVTLR